MSQALKKPKRYDKIKTKDGWLICPMCRRTKIIKTLPSTRATDLVLYCRACKAAFVVNSICEPEP